MQKIKSFLIWLPAVIWYGLIFLLSAQPAYKSEAVSDTVTGNALSAGGSGYVNAEVIVQESVEELLSLFVRKGAHMFLFFVLAILVWLALVGAFCFHQRYRLSASPGLSDDERTLSLLGGATQALGQGWGRF